MRAAAVAVIILAVAILHFTPSATPYSPHNPGPSGLSKLAQTCAVSEQADVIIITPGAEVPELNITAGIAPIVDPYANAGDPHIIIANARGTPVYAINATPLMGSGQPLIWTSPASNSNGSWGPFTLALAVRKGDKIIYIYHAALFANAVFEKNSRLVEEICKRPISIVSTQGDLAHYYHQLERQAAAWAAPIALATISLYSLAERRKWPYAP
ncbi:hypothetical protein [Pyrobaculum sp.]|uniref:hypothetical protein n=1 Tax=Pyrobaculum sp. TaxID=2004705 RepID=UPI00316EBAF2